MSEFKRTRVWAGRRASWRVAVGLLIGLMSAGCAQQTVKTQALTKLDRLETDLKRGVSKKPDVLFLLGEPDGSGGALFPTASSSHEVWYYEATRVSLKGLSQKILLIYFNGDLFDGYQWFSNTADMDIQ